MSICECCIMVDLKNQSCNLYAGLTYSFVSQRRRAPLAEDQSSSARVGGQETTVLPPLPGCLGVMTKLWSMSQHPLREESLPGFNTSTRMGAFDQFPDKENDYLDSREPHIRPVLETLEMSKGDTEQ